MIKTTKCFYEALKMFSGIIEEIGLITQADHAGGLSTLTIQSSVCPKDVHLGDSISVNGVCLTVCDHTLETFMFQVIPETLKLTNLGTLYPGSNVNLERSITPLTRLGGHYVQGHVDGTATISRLEHEGDSLKIWCQKPIHLQDFFIPKGYIAVDGMSLTLVDVTQDTFSLCIIPHTLKVTIVKNYKVGTFVNIEIDQMTKTILHFLKQRA